ncbi:MAG: branched-chain amino acid ABC transporter ATP-binding protein/permease [Actinomycetota bacterium]
MSVARREYRSALKAIGLAALILAPWIPIFPGTRGILVGVANLAGEWALVAISLVLLTGWVGQISLGQSAFVGVGAFVTGLLARAGVPFPVNLPIAATLGAAVAAVLGLVALRVRGLYLAVATLIFAYMADSFLFSSAWFVGGSASIIPNRIIGRSGTITVFDFRHQNLIYVVVLASVGVAWFVCTNLRDSKTGRAFFAVRGSETAAVSLGIDVRRYKLMAFAISGAIAATAGNLIMLDLKAVTAQDFTFTKSLFFLGIAVTGGVSSIGGAAAVCGLFAFLASIGTLWSNPVTSVIANNLDLVSAILLLLVLLFFPGGLGAIGNLWSRNRKQGPRLPEDDGESVASLRPAWRELTPGECSVQAEVVLEARDIEVRFGGLVAARDLNLRVCKQQIVGLIGPNGAGKTTMFNAIAGLNEPSNGSIHLFGRDVTRTPVHLRAQMGIGRTFQLIQLFGQLDVFDNLLVATHMHNRTGMWSHLTLVDRALEAEKDSHARVHDMIAMIGLEDVAHRRVSDLPFGILRYVELARALVTQAPLLMLDEPASGLDSNETAEFAKLLRFIRAELGVSILLIEHDMHMVTSVCDYIYVINRGEPLAEGTAEEIQRHPDVISAYLGQPEVVHA